MLRRAFLSRVPALAIVQAPAAPVAPTRSWAAARHAEDDWLDDNAAKHRNLFDTYNPEHFPDALLFSGNIFETNLAAYEIAAKDLAVLLVVRHNTTPFGYNDAMWAKYGKHFSKRMDWVDPKTHEVPAANIYTSRFAGLAKNGLRLAVCQRTTRAYVSIIARDTGDKAEDVYTELTSNLVIPGRVVPAGVITVTRAQERGYTLVTVA
jgi:intracellular sulfur oxidation DsrE/DsrF family protein